MSKEEFLKTLGKRIVKLRTGKGISQAELARLSFKDPQSIERIENGKTNASVYYLSEIATALGISVSELTDIGKD